MQTIRKKEPVVSSPNRNQNREFFLSCAGKMEEIAKSELEKVASEKNLRISSVNINKGGIYFRATIADAFTAGLHMRTAGRVLLNLKKIYFLNENDFYKKAAKFDWSSYISPGRTFKIETKFDLGVDKKLRNSHFMSLKLKDSIVDQIREKTGTRPTIEKNNPDIFIRSKIVKGKGILQAHIFVDLFGEPLSRRGYRVAGHVAPLKEDLAAAIVSQMDITEDTPVIDCMCGSGTILIEAFLKANNIGPQFLKINQHKKNKTNYSLMYFESISHDDREKLQKILVNYSKEIILNLENIKNKNIKGFDFSKESVTLTRKNIRAAGFENYISVELQDAQKLTPAFDHGILFCNPPYGERLSDEKQLENLYYNLGENLKRNFTGYTAWVFTGNPELRKKISLRTEKRVPFFNGAIECRLLKYSLF